MHACPLTCLALNEDQLILSGSSLGGVTVSGLSSDQHVAILKSTGSACKLPLVLISVSQYSTGVSVGCILSFTLFYICLPFISYVIYILPSAHIRFRRRCLIMDCSNHLNLINVELNSKLFPSTVEVELQLMESSDVHIFVPVLNKISYLLSLTPISILNRYKNLVFQPLFTSSFCGVNSWTCFLLGPQV